MFKTKESDRSKLANLVMAGGTVAGDVPCLRNCEYDTNDEQWQQHVVLFVFGIDVDVIKHVVTFGFLLMRRWSSERYHKKDDHGDQRKRPTTAGMCDQQREGEIDQ